MLHRFILLTGIVISIALLCQAQAPPVDVAPLVQIAYDKEVIVTQWEHNAQTQMAWTIAGILFGGLITILQPWGSQTWCKVAASTLGIGTAVVTGLISKAPVNYSSYQKSALSARAKIGSLHDDIHMLKAASTPEEQKEWRDQFTATVKEISQIHSGLSGDQTAAVWAPTGMVYAQSAKPAGPAWTDTLPTAVAAVYFRGEGVGRSLSEAKADSLQKAINQGASKLPPPAKPLPAESLGQYVKSSAAVVDTSFQVDRNSGLVRYYTLMKMDKSFARPGVIAALSSPVPIVKPVVTAPKSAPAIANKRE